MKHENTRRLFAYWNALREGRMAPYRSEVDPRAIAPLLESTFILEHYDGGAPRFRLAGTRLCDQFGLELRGMSALALWHGESRTQLRSLLANVVTKPVIGHVACTVETRGGHLFDAEFLYLPLRSDLGEMTRILGCGYYMRGFEHTIPGHEPIHHWIDAVNEYPIDAPVEEIAATRAAPGPRIADPATMMKLTRATRPSGPPALRAIEGGLAAGTDTADSVGPTPRAARRPFLRLVKTDSVKSESR